jgi:hypothetical protein
LLQTILPICRPRYFCGRNIKQAEKKLDGKSLKRQYLSAKES